MPAAVVKSPADEKKWTKAKEIVKKQYPDVNEGDDRFYALVMGVFKQMKGGQLAKALGCDSRGRIFLKAKVQAPGSRGGRYYFTKPGGVAYGEKPVQTRRELGVEKIGGLPVVHSRERAGGGGVAVAQRTIKRLFGQKGEPKVQYAVYEITHVGVGWEPRKSHDSLNSAVAEANRLAGGGAANEYGASKKPKGGGQEAPERYEPPVSHGAGKGQYPFARKEAQYANYTDAELQYALNDARETRDIWDAASRKLGHEPGTTEAANANWYADDVHTIGKEIITRRKNPGKRDAEVKAQREAARQRAMAGRY